MSKQRWPFFVLGAAIVASGLLLLYLGRGQTPVVDQWAYISAYQGWDPSTLVTPHNGHLVVFPVIVEKLIASIFGLESQLPFQLLTVALSATVASLLFALTRDAVGDLLALGASVLILFYGAGADVIVPTFQISNLIGLSSGLATLLALRRNTLAGDIAACGFLGMSLASFSVGIAFAAGAVVAVALREPGHRLHRWWVVLLPILAYAAWTLWARKFGQSHLYVHNLKIIGSAVLDQAGAVLSAITGLFTTPNGPPPDANPVPIRTTWGPVLVAGLATLVVFRLRRAPRPGPNAVIAGVVLLTYFLLVAIALNQYRNTFDTRLVYLGSVLMLVALAALMAPYRPSRTVLGIAGIVFLVSMSANIAELSDSAQFWRDQSSLNRSKLAAVEIAGPAASGEVRIEAPPEGMTFLVAQYRELDAKFGMPADSEAELRDSSPADRKAADRELARVLVLEPRPAPVLDSFATEGRIFVRSASGGRARKAGACIALTPGPSGTSVAELELPPRGFFYVSGRAPEELLLGRFADEPVVELSPRYGPTIVRIPTDNSETRWFARVTAPERTLLCPVPA